MPKMKTRQAVKKRFKITANGKVMHSRAGKNHLLTGKSSNRKKNLSGETEISKADKKRVKQMLPGY
ncbi:MAG: 50S ribosomal protein L35 [bacterium]